MDQKIIMVVDDETHILNVLAIKLQNAGFKVIAAEDGADAFKLAQSYKPSLIITDYQMPILSGVELCCKLQNDQQLRDIPVILLTARGFTISDDDLKNGNIKQVIAKPFSPREVLSCVIEQLDEASVGVA